MQSPWPYKIAETHIIFMLPYTMSKSIFFYTPFLSPRMENFFFPCLEKLERQSGERFHILHPPSTGNILCYN
ncbi:hypothetical protein GBL_1866 [Geobacillus kaustophilus GBlys]|uniref:Uncharacterized protein n=1 Tax=Geobacillus kaustophilus GBlys TaxID=1337888 RepID=U2Y392_GEOKU|nr:hypothetical protein GBL_1866 [Geobacillus kaustophilus GBlys]